MEYEEPGQEAQGTNLVAASERLIRTIRDIGIRELVRFGIGRRILEKLVQRKFVDAQKLRHYAGRVREYKLSKSNS